MLRQFIFVYAAVVCLGGLPALCQNTYQFEITKAPVICDKGSASLSMQGTDPGDTLTITWSTGQTQVSSLSNLDEGDYSVTIHIQNKLDTSLYFSIDKEECPVSISRQFTPNGDGYNDFFYIGNVSSYPDFELEIFNKWGQRVHRQKGNYVPWDGTWAGTRVPDGTYYFVFFFDSSNKNKLLKGDVIILR